MLATTFRQTRLRFESFDFSWVFCIISFKFIRGSGYAASFGNSRHVRKELEELFGPRLVSLVLFGSHARGDAEPGSDIDLLVVLRGEVNAGEEINRTGGIVTDLSLKNDVVISCIFMGEQRYLHRDGPLLRNIRREGIAA